MTWFKRIFFFVALNVLVVLTISIILNVLGIRPYITARGIDYNSLLAFCLVWGMGGAFISLALSRQMAKWMMGVKIIDPKTQDPQLRTLLEKVYSLARRSGLATMPQVGVFNSPESNAFATGPTKARSLVAVSTGLLQRMNTDELDGVLGHEISHIANGDMVTMTLLQGVVNAFAMFLARVIAFAITQSGRDRESRGSFGSYYLIQFALEMVFMILGSIVVCWFSRQREFRADAGGARLAGRERMIAALQALQKTVAIAGPQRQQSFQTMQISNPRPRWLGLFSTHPSLELRIKRLSSSHTLS